MDITQRLDELESTRDWQGLTEALEQAIAQESDDHTKSRYFLKLGRVLVGKLLQAPRALKHFQTAWKLQPQVLAPLRDASDVYWDLGKLKMVSTVLKRSIDSAENDQQRAEVLCELGDVSCDLGNYELAAQAYGQAAQLDAETDAGACLADLQDDAPAERLQLLMEAAEQEQDSAIAVRFLLRAARLAHAHESPDYETILLQAYQLRPGDRQAAALYEGVLVADGRLAQVLETQKAMLEHADDVAGPQLAYRFGVSWTQRHQNLDLGSRLLEQAVLGDPENDAAFTFLRSVWSREKDWERVAALAEQVVETHGGAPAYLLAEGGRISWRELGDMRRARTWFERLALVAPEHPQVAAFEAQIGESLSVIAADEDEQDAVDVDAVADAEVVAEVEQIDDDVDVVMLEPAEEVVDAPISEAAVSGAGSAAEEDEPELDESVASDGGAADDADADDEPPQKAAPKAAPTAAEPAEQDDELIAQLLAEAEEQEQARRNHDYVKTLVRLAEAYVDRDKKLEHYRLAAGVYQKFSNASEAAKCYASIFELDQHDDEAADFLKKYYEKRRDWDSLIALLRQEADGFDDPDIRLAKYIEIAQLAANKVKKPPICIELWSLVREQDPQNEEALNELSSFYERARDYENLASVLTEQAEMTADVDERVKILEKLAQLEGDRLKNEEAAADAWRQVLELRPGDRRAQENLKKKLLALGRWDDLELLYEDSGKWDEFIRLLESQEAREEDPTVKVGMLMKVADLWESKKGKLDRASRAYEKILGIDEQNLAAAEALIPIYSDGNNAKGLANAIEVKLGHLDDGEGAFQLYQEVAGLYETKLRKPDLALERYLSALKVAPGNEQAAEDVERVAGATDNWGQAVAAYAEALVGAEDAATEGALRLRMGRVHLDELNQVDQALEQYRAVYELDPDNGAALSALERLYRQTERYAELLEVYEKQRDLAQDADAQRGVLYRIAALYQDELGDANNAIQTYWAVLEVEQADAEALAALDRLYLAQQNWEQYADVLRRRLEIDVEEEELVDLKYRLGQTQQLHLADPAAALENYREILFVDPNNDRAREALEGLLEHPELNAEVARILAEVYEGRDEWNKLIVALEILVGAEDDDSDRVALLRKIGMVAAEQLQDNERAFEAQARALVVAPDSAEVRLELEDFTERAQAYERLAAVFSQVAAELTDAELARDYWMRLAQIQRRLEQVDEAAASYQRVLDIDPADSEALNAMEDLFRANERWNDLIGVSRRRIDLAEDSAERERLYAQVANIYDGRLGKPEEAIAAYNEVLAFDQTSVAALRALDDLFTRQSLHQELAENLDQQLRLAETEDQEIGLMLRLAVLQETELAIPEAAIETYRQVIERQPQNAAAIAALERLGKSPEYEIEISEVLGPLYRNSGNYEKLLGVYEVQVRRSDDPTRAVELLHEMSELHEDAAGDLNAAFNTLARALGLEPGAPQTQQGLQRLANATDRFADLAQVYEQLAGQQEDVELAIQLYTVSATIYEQQLGTVDNAIAHYRKILELDEHHLEAIVALERIFRSVDRYAELSQVLQQRAGLLHDLDEQKRALMQSAQIEEEVLEQPETAVAVYSKVLELDAEDLPALDALIKLYLAMERWPKLLEAYNRKVDLVFDADERKRIYFQMGAVYESELNDVPNAIDIYNRALEIDPDDLEALSRLDVLYQQAEDWPELLNVLQRQSDLAADPVESISYGYRIAELYDKRLEDVERSIELYRDLLQQQPDHQPTLEALEALTQGERQPLGAAQVLEPIYDVMGEWQRLIAVLEVQVRVIDDPFQRVELLHRIARLHEEMLNDPSSAFSTFARAVAADVTNDDSLAQFERLASMTQRWPELAQLYDAQLAGALAQDPVRFSEIGLRVAAIYEEQIEDFDSAIARYKQVLDADAENHAAIVALDRLYEGTERFEELAGILQKEAELAPDGDAMLAFRFRLGQVQQHRLNNIDGAISAYGEVIQEMPEHEGALSALEGLFAAGTEQLRVAEILEPHYENLGQFEHLASVYEAVLAHKVEPADRLAQYYRLAQLYDERLLAADSALAVDIRALQEYPSDVQTLDEVERLSDVVEDGWEHLANAYADVLAAHERPEVQTSIGKRLARVFEEQLGDVDKAEETYRYVLSVAPREVDCLNNLDRIYTALERYPELAGVLEQRVLTSEEPYELIELYTRLGEIYEGQLAPLDVAHLDNAVRVYRKIFDQLEPDNEQAQQALERLYSQQQKWTELYGVYDRQLEHAPSEMDQADIAAKQARLLAAHLGDVNRSIDTWKRVLELRGEDGEALGALSDLYETTEQWAELTEILERHMAMVIDDQEQVAVLLRRARLYTQQLGRDDAALEDYSRVLDLDFANYEALYAINDIWRRRQDIQELLYALHQTVDRAAATLPAEHQVALYREVATLHQGQEDQTYEAIDAWRKLLEVDPRDFDAMASLEHLLRNEERWEEVVQVKMTRARAFAEPAKQVDEYLEVAKLWETKIGNEDGATPALEAVLQIDPVHRDAFDQLEKLHKYGERHEALIELYVNRVEELEEQTDQQTKLLRKVARVYDEKLNDQEQAYDALETAFTLDFEDEDTVAYLEKMAGETKRWAQLVQLVNGWLEEAQDPATQIALSLRLAKWYGEDLDREEYAMPYYQKVLSLDPNNVGVLRQMANVHKKRAQWREQGQMLQRALDVATSDGDRAAILTDMGEVLEKRMEKADQGMAYYKRALDADPFYVPALEALETMYTERQSVPELVDVLKAKAKGLRDDELIAETKLRTAGLLETSLGQLDEAAEVYRGVLDLDAGNLVAIKGLERIYTNLQKWPDLLQVLEMHLDVAATERERAEVLLQIAHLQEEQFLKPDLAAARLEQVVEIDPVNMPAFEMLARCYHKQRQWLDLIGALERHINATDDRDKKIQLLMQVAETYAVEVQDQERALDSYLNVIDLDANHVPALEAVAQLYERMDDPANAIEFMSRVADLTVDGGLRVEAFYRIGRQLEDKLSDRHAARERFEQALDLDPSHVPTLGALREIAMDEADWDMASRYLDMEQQNTEAPRPRAKLLVELGRLRAEMLEQPQEAIEAYELAHQADPDNEEAALPLAREYVRQERWAEAEPHTDMLSRKAGKKERMEQLELYMLHGLVEQKLNKYDESLKSYTAAHKLDLTNQDAIRGLADVNFQLGDWAGALTNYQKVLTSLGESDIEQRAEVYFRLGCVKREQGQGKQAINNFEKGLALDAGHRATLEALVAIYENLNDYTQSCVYRQQILDNIIDADERYELLIELAEIWATKVGDPQQGIYAYEQALDLKPDDHQLQHRMLQLYQKTGQWEQVVDILQQIAERDPVPERRARYLFTMAQAYRDKLNDPYRAAELFDEALDLNPDYLDAFKRIDKLYTGLKDWGKLERAYRKMIHRVAGQGKAELEYNLWHALGLIYRDRLQDGGRAVEAFGVATQVKPDVMEDHLILAELAEQMGRYDDAVNSYRTILSRDAMNIDAYRAIYNIFLRRQTYDEAWCAAGILTFVRRANEEEQRFYTDWRPSDIPKVSAKLDNEAWVRHLFHEDEDLYIGKIFEAIAIAALKAKMDALKAKNDIPVLPAQFLQDPQSSTSRFARTFWWAAQVLGIRPPALYARTDVGGGLTAVPVEPVASVAGAGVLQGLNPLESAFVAGQHLAMYRGEHYIKTLFPTVTELTVLLFAAIRLVAPKTPAPGEYAKQVQATAESLARYMQPMQLEALKVVVNRFLKEGARANIKRWAQAVQTTAARAGLLLAGDLEVAKKIIAAQPQIPGDLSPQERLKDLMLYSASDGYFKLRAKLGIQINPEGG